MPDLDPPAPSFPWLLPLHPLFLRSSWGVNCVSLLVSVDRAELWTSG